MASADSTAIDYQGMLGIMYPQLVERMLVSIGHQSEIAQFKQRNGGKFQLSSPELIGKVTYGESSLDLHLAPGFPDMAYYKTGLGSGALPVEPHKLYAKEGLLSSADQYFVSKRKVKIAQPRCIESTSGQSGRARLGLKSVALRRGTLLGLLVSIYEPRYFQPEWTQLTCSTEGVLGRNEDSINRGCPNSPNVSYLLCRIYEMTSSSKNHKILRYSTVICAGIAEVSDGPRSEYRSWNEHDRYLNLPLQCELSSRYSDVFAAPPVHHSVSHSLSHRHRVIYGDATDARL